jgi:hypothetical protein
MKDYSNWECDWCDLEAKTRKEIMAHAMQCTHSPMWKAACALRSAFNEATQVMAIKYDSEYARRKNFTERVLSLLGWFVCDRCAGAGCGNCAGSPLPGFQFVLPSMEEDDEPDRSTDTGHVDALGNSTAGDATGSHTPSAEGDQGSGGAAKAAGDANPVVRRETRSVSPGIRWWLIGLSLWVGFQSLAIAYKMMRGW